MTPAKPAARTDVLPQGSTGTSSKESPVSDGLQSLAGTGWDGVERRNNVERRSGDRRQLGRKGPLDTRTGNDRRLIARRSTDQALAGRLFIKV
ncbi:hypothetical protein SAMN05660284_01956 [Formivibrio citricus]|uniref:Uncharacterized protein n=1 Tax=Formivibrio citricus TaxID=83765 RepID=A0A1I5AQH2_9NEIS|nr:hypothetical protein SAMN05660284_01956 [Formivibrio citricus]